MERHGTAHLPHRQPALPDRSRHQRPPSRACRSRAGTRPRRFLDRSGGSPDGGRLFRDGRQAFREESAPAPAVS
ncbi:Hypothetical Protein RSKD131_1859 [Cereibacter sphaeroides KD131]|nr:Hypothetical Protein RSKD131_1859 [Cereibacter sphaeroides KD131]